MKVNNESPWTLRFHGLSKQERLFLLLFALVGMSQAEAYQIGFQSDATLNSCSAMASRLLRENRCLAALGLLDLKGYVLAPKCRRYLKLANG